MTIKEIDNYFLSLQREPKNNCRYTLLHTRQGNAGNKFPFIVFLGSDNLKEPNIVLLHSNNIYSVMEYVKEFLNKYSNIGYFYA